VISRFSLVFICFSFLSASLQAQLLSLEELKDAYEYKSIEEAKKEPEKVIRLELKRQDLDSLPLDILEFKNLQYLSLRKNQLKNFPSELSVLKHLQVLDLSKNELPSIPEEISSFNNLKHLILNNNELTALPPEIGKLSKLQYLDLWANPMRDFPKELGQLRSLKEIDLRDMSFSDKEEKYLFSIMPGVKIQLSHSCDCH